MIYLIGLVSGVLSGMAIGGGTVLVPILVLVMGKDQHVAQGIALAAFLPISFVAIITHYRQGNIDTGKVIFLVTGSVLGAVIGSNLALKLPCITLKKVFGLFLIVMGLYEFFGRGATSKITKG